MFRRARAPIDPVTIFLDGESVPAERGEPLAVALLSADKSILARSPKLHRPRSASCLRGGCDGCLARVDGEPNVMTCLRAARGGERIETQNVVGSRKADLLRVTDWLFHDGIDHHHLMAGVPGVSEVMQGFARKLAGLGRLPSSATPVRPAARLELDALVIGAGLAGLTAASRLSAAGTSVGIVDDGLELGGSLVCLGEGKAALLSRIELGPTKVLGRAAALGVYGPEVLVGSEQGATLVRARALVIASGAHDGVLPVPNNDLPGVFSARALCRLVAHGVQPDGPVVVAGSGFWADELARVLEEPPTRVRPEDLAAVVGTGSVREAVVLEDGAERRVAAAVVAFAVPGAPVFEQALQAGAAVELVRGAGYAIVRDARGRAAEGVWATGECTGAPFEPRALVEDAELVAAAVLEALSPR